MHIVTDSSPNDSNGDDDDIFAATAEGFQHMLEMLGGAQAPSWEQAAQVAAAIASNGVSEANIDPLARISFEQLARVASLQVAAATGFSLIENGREIEVALITRTEWCSETLSAYRSLFEPLAGSLGGSIRLQMGELTEEDVDQIRQFLPPGANLDLSKLVSALQGAFGPALAAGLAGTVVGQLGSRAFGTYDLPIPRLMPQHLSVIGTALDEFSADWELPVEDLRLWMCLDELCHHAVLSVPHVGSQLSELLTEHARSFSLNEEKIGNYLQQLDLDPSALASGSGLEAFQAALMQPGFVLDALESSKQAELRPRIDALVTAVEGYVAWTVDSIGSRLIGSYSQVAEALRRRRIEADQATQFVERLFGLELTAAKLDTGRAFIDGLVQRAGVEVLTELWASRDSLPTPSDVVAPGLWLARMGIEISSELDLGEGSFEVPDFPDIEEQ
jgi:putative hydrolase